MYVSLMGLKEETGLTGLNRAGHTERGPCRNVCKKKHTEQILPITQNKISYKCIEKGTPSNKK
jgi:hypothetical protein